MNEFIDLYCERGDAGLWAEPFNALSNLAFILAALLAYRLILSRDRLAWDTLTLAVLIALIGIGSALFHTLATRWAQAADVIPIGFFQVLFIVLYMRKVMHYKTVHIVVAVTIFAALSAGLALLPREWLNGSLNYLPALFFMAWLGIWQMKNTKEEGFSLLLAAGLFSLSLAFRALDLRVCGIWPFGLHFIWHILNGAVLYWTLRAYVLQNKAF